MRQDRTSVSFLVPSVPFGNVLEQISITARSGVQFDDVLSAIDRRMRLLQAVTRDLPDGYMRLQLQRRLSQPGRSDALRWVQGSRQTTVRDRRAEEIIVTYPASMREWFASVHAEMCWLNTQMRLCRVARREFSHLTSFLTAASCMSSMTNEESIEQGEEQCLT